MAMLEHEFGEYGDLLPPALTVDQEPFDPADLDAWADGPLNGEQLAHAFADDSADDYQPAKAKVVAFTITDDELAEWAMAHVAQIDGNMERLDEQRRRLVERIDRWHAGAVHRLTLRRQFFTAHLTAYAAAHRRSDPKRNKTLRLPSGVVKSTERQAVAEISDEARVVAWAKTMGDTVRAAVVQVKETALVSTLRDHVTVTDTVVGYDVTLDCGHVFTLPDAVEPDEQMLCTACADPITNEPEQRTVAVVDEMHRDIVVDANGHEVPGATVKPTTVTYAVVPS